jgi:hypothetical protein
MSEERSEERSEEWGVRRSSEKWGVRSEEWEVRRAIRGVKREGWGVMNEEWELKIEECGVRSEDERAKREEWEVRSEEWWLSGEECLVNRNQGWGQRIGREEWNKEWAEMSEANGVRSGRNEECWIRIEGRGWILKSEVWWVIEPTVTPSPSTPNFFHSPFQRINSKLKLLPIYIKLYLHFLKNNFSDMMQNFKIHRKQKVKKRL